MVDVKKLQYYLNSPLMKRIVELKERNYTEKDQFDDAPVNYDDAIENYKRLLDITDDVSRNIIEPNSESVDQEGPHLVDGRMVLSCFHNLCSCLHIIQSQDKDIHTFNVFW